jgi:uncharacterized protein (TIGR02217 family)
MSFIEERLLECATFGSVMAPTWRTRKIPLRSGIVRRNPLRSRPLYRLTLMYKNLTPDLHAEVIRAFNACMAGVYSFRVKDWSDFEADDEIITADATGASQSVQLIKTYTFGTASISRNIRKPIEDTVEITENNVPISFVLDSVGVATFTAPIHSIVRWSGEFDVPMMFEEDELPFSGDDKGKNGLFLTADVALIEDLDI